MMVWLLFLICLCLPAYQIRFKIGFLPMTLLEVLILILFFSWFFLKLRPKAGQDLADKEKGLKIFREKWQALGIWSWLILFWLLLASAAVFRAQDLRAGAGIFKAFFLGPVLFFLVLTDCLKSEKERKIVLFGLFLSAFYLSFFALFQKFFGGGVMSLEALGQPKVWRATSLFPQPNFLGLYLGPIAILLLGRKQNIFFLITFFLSIFAIILARSEGALLGVFFGLLFFFLLFSGKTRKIALISFLILAILVLSFAPSRNFLTEKIVFHDLSGRLRLNIWQGAWSLLKTSPFLGVGLGGYQNLVPQFQQPYYFQDKLISVETHPYPHNFYLALWLELGFLGLLVFWGILVKFFVSIFRRIKNNPSSKRFLLAVAGAMIVILIHGLVDTPYFKNDLSVLFWLIIGLSVLPNHFKNQKC